MKVQNKHTLTVTANIFDVILQLNTIHVTVVQIVDHKSFTNNKYMQKDEGSPVFHQDVRPQETWTWT